MTTTRFPLSLTLGRVHSTHRDDFMKLEIRDETNLQARLIIELSMEQFGKLLAGEYRLKVEAEGINADEFGWPADAVSTMPDQAAG